MSLFEKFLGGNRNKKPASQRDEAQELPPELAQALDKLDPGHVCVYRSSGALDKDWSIVGRECRAGQWWVQVSKVQENGQMLSKDVMIESLLEANAAPSDSAEGSFSSEVAALPEPLRAITALYGKELPVIIPFTDQQFLDPVGTIKGEPYPWNGVPTIDVELRGKDGYENARTQYSVQYLLEQHEDLLSAEQRAALDAYVPEE
jgi:hypothetical protein